METGVPLDRMKGLDFETLPSEKAQSIGTKIPNILGMKAHAKPLIDKLLRRVSTDHLQTVSLGPSSPMRLGVPSVLREPALYRGSVGRTRCNPLV